MTRNNASTVLATASMFFANGFAFSTWVSRIPDIQKRAHLATWELGAAMLAIGLGALFAMKFGGSTSHRFGSRIVTFVMLLLTALFLALIPMGDNFGLLSAILFGFGICASSMDVAMNAHGVAVQRRLDHPILSSMHALWSVGGVAGSGLGSLMASQNITPQMHFLCAAVFLVVLAVAARFFLLSKDAEMEGTQSEAQSQAGEDAGKDKVPAIIIMLAVVCFLAFMAEGAVADWSALYLQQCLGASDAFAPLGFGAFSFAMSGGRFAGDIATKKFGPNNLLRYGSLLSALSIAFVVIMKQQIAAIVGFVFAGIGMATIVPILFSTAGNVDTARTAKSIGRVAVAGYVGLLVGPPILGFAAQQWGMQVTLIAVAGISTIIFLLAQSVDCTRGAFE